MSPVVIPVLVLHRSDCCRADICVGRHMSGGGGIFFYMIRGLSGTVSPLSGLKLDTPDPPNRKTDVFAFHIPCSTALAVLVCLRKPSSQSVYPPFNTISISLMYVELGVWRMLPVLLGPRAQNYSERTYEMNVCQQQGRT
jgi:hypothetical protein